MDGTHLLDVIDNAMSAAMLMVDEASAADFLAALKDAGYVIVPKEPTKQMVIAGDDEKENCIDSGWDSDTDGNRYDYTIINSDLPARVYRAMLAAAEEQQPT